MFDYLFYGIINDYVILFLRIIKSTFFFWFYYWYIAFACI